MSLSPLPGGWSPTQPQRLVGVPLDEITERQREGLKTWWPPYNLHRAAIHHVDRIESWIPFGTAVLRDNKLDVLHRELAILRLAWNANCAYEWGQHAKSSVEKWGISQEVVDRVVAGPDAPGWTPLEAALVRGVDELMSQWAITDGTYAILEANLTKEQLIDYIFVIGHYLMVAMFLNGFRIELDPGLAKIPSR